MCFLSADVYKQGGHHRCQRRLLLPAGTHLRADTLQKTKSVARSAARKLCLVVKGARKLGEQRRGERQLPTGCAVWCGRHNLERGERRREKRRGDGTETHQRRPRSPLTWMFPSYDSFPRSPRSGKSSGFQYKGLFSKNSHNSSR